MSWADSVAYILSADMTKEGQDITSPPVYYVVFRISMKVEGDLKLDKWYPLDIEGNIACLVCEITWLADSHQISEELLVCRFFGRNLVNVISPLQESE